MRIALVVLLCLVALAAEAGQSSVAGVVKDEFGGVVSGALVIVRSESGVERQTLTGPDGRFSLGVPATSGTVIVRAVGFAEKTQPASSEVEVTLQVEGLGGMTRGLPALAPVHRPASFSERSRLMASAIMTIPKNPPTNSPNQNIMATHSPFP